MANIIEELKRAGYEPNLSTNRWEKIQEESALRDPQLGQGNFSRVHSCLLMDNGVHNPTLTDTFTTKDRLLKREWKPYPAMVMGKRPVKWAEVSVGWHDIGRSLLELYLEDPMGWTLLPEYQRLLLELTYHYMPGRNKSIHDRTYLAVNFRGRGAGRVFYRPGGKIDHLNIGSPGGRFISFHLVEGEIVDGDSNTLSPLDTVLNTGKPLLFDERWFYATQTASEVQATVVNPVTGQRLGGISVPPSVNMRRIQGILMSDSKEWIQILEHVPVKNLGPQTN